MTDEAEAPSTPAQRWARVAWRAAQVGVMVVALVYVTAGCLQQRFWRSPMLSLTCPLAIPLLIAVVWYTLVRFWRAVKEARGGG